MICKFVPIRIFVIMKESIKTPWRFILTEFLLLKVLTLGAIWYGLQYVVYQNSFPRPNWEVLIPGLRLPWLIAGANFDGVHYLVIASEGYSFALSQAFFPLFPLIIRYTNWIVSNYLITGLLVSHLFFIASLAFFYKLIRLDYSEATARRAIIFLCFFPTSFYFLSVYTESLFLFLVVLFFYWLRTGHFAKAGMIGIAITLTKIIGIFIVPVMLYEIWKGMKTGEHENIKTLKQMKEKSHAVNQFSIFNFRLAQKFLSTNYQLLTTYLWALVPALGLLGYMVYLNQRFDDPFLFAHVQSAFGAGRETDRLVLLYQVFWRYLKMIATVSWSTTMYYTVVLEFGMTLASLGLIVWGFIKGVRTSYLLFSILALILPTLTGTFSSMPRYILAAFPIFIILGFIEKPWLQNLVLAINTVLLIVSTVFFTRGYWIG